MLNRNFLTAFLLTIVAAVSGCSSSTDVVADETAAKVTIDVEQDPQPLTHPSYQKSRATQDPRNKPRNNNFN